MSQPRIWGLILSRKGSKRLPGKALLPLNGKPMLAYSFTAAKNARQLDQCWFFSDDPDAQQLAFDMGVSLPPFERPESVSGDQVSSEVTVRHFLSAFPPSERPDIFVLLQATSPLRESSDIDAAIEHYLDSQADALVSITCPQKPLSWAYQRKENGELLPAFNDPAPDLVYPNGAIYITATSRLLSGEALVSGRVQGYEMPWERSIDIDTREDYEWAQYWLSHQLKQVGH